MKRAVQAFNGLLATIVGSGAIVGSPVLAQVVPNPGDTNTIVNQTNNLYTITGGKLSGDNANLFHSLSQFGLTPTQIANFLSTPNIRNILVRVTGGTASQIDGQIKITGSNANLFLMNPSGIVFGPTANLNVPASFTATTANAIGFGNSWFNASGSNNYEALVGTPSRLAFSMAQPGAIINQGNLMVESGQQLALIGGTVISSGGLLAPQGQIVVAAVPGESVVRLIQPGSLLSLEIQRPDPTTQVESWNLPIVSLPKLLTGGSGRNATQVTVDASGQVRLAGSGIQIQPGDVAVNNANTGTDNGVLLSAKSQVYRADAFLNDGIQGRSNANSNPQLTAPPDQFLPSNPVVSGTSLTPDSSPIQNPTSVNIPIRYRFSVPSPSTNVSPPPEGLLPSVPATVPNPAVMTPPLDTYLPPTDNRNPKTAIPTLNAAPVDCATACPTAAQPKSTGTESGVVISETPSKSVPVIQFSSPDTKPSIQLNQPLPQYSDTATAETESIATAPASRPADTVNATARSPVLQDNWEYQQTSNPIHTIDISATDTRLEAVRKYFQKRWQPSPGTTALQYQLLVDRKGSMQRIQPLSQDAANYLTNLALTAISGSLTTVSRDPSSLEVIVTLNPDGTVEVISNALTLKN